MTKKALSYFSNVFSFDDIIIKITFAPLRAGRWKHGRKQHDGDMLVPKATSATETNETSDQQMELTRAFKLNPATQLR